MKTQLPETAAPAAENASDVYHHDEDGLELSLSMPLPGYGGQSRLDDATIDAPSTEVKVVTATGPIFSHGGPCSASSMTANMCWLPDASAGGYTRTLAGRREGAAADLGWRPPTPPSGDINSGPHGSPVVGWPPVRATRKNIAGPRAPKTGMEAAAEKGAKRAKTALLAAEEEEEEEDGEAKKEKEGRNSSTMFVKVNMEGVAVGRKIDLMAHDGYRSLSRAVRTMFDNFLPAGNGKQTAAKCSGRGEEEDDADLNLILLYEDNEGDKMLVGDVPWKMFLGSVKRLYIAYRPPKVCFPVNGGEQAKEGENEQCATHLAR